MLTESQIEEILDSKVAFQEFTTAALVQAIAVALSRVQDPKTSANALAALVEVLRKIRMDALGKAEPQDIPTMMVNIKFDSIQGTPPSALKDVSGNLIEHKYEH